jgi:hypothetical protein
VQYTLGWSHDDGSAVNQYDWSSEWAYSSGDTRHRLTALASVALPRNSNMSFTITANSGRPYTMTTGKDENGDQATNDRPLGIERNSLRGPGTYNVSMSFSKTFNLKRAEVRQGNNFAGQQIILPPPPPGGGQIVVAGGQGGPIIISAPAGVPAVQPGPRLSFNVSANNLLNNTQIRGYSGVLTSNLFGKPIGASNGRSLTMGLNLQF